MNNDMPSPNQNLVPAESAAPSQQPIERPSVAPTKQKKTFVIILIAAVLLLVAMAVIYLVNSSGLFASADQRAIVKITGKGFDPQTLRIKKGQQVEWVNQDADAHQVASDPFPDHSLLPDLFADSPMSKGESFTYTFEDAGTYTYHDQLKPADFKGTVIVE